MALSQQLTFDAEWARWDAARNRHGGETVQPSDRVTTVPRASSEFATTAPAVETVAEGEKGAERYRRDARVKRYLFQKRPTDTQRLIDYRTCACVGYNEAVANGADADVVAFLKMEHDWALERLREVAPEVVAKLAAAARAQEPFASTAGPPVVQLAQRGVRPMTP